MSDPSLPPMLKWVVRFTRIPTAYNDPQAMVVEAATPDDAKAIVRDHLRDLGGMLMHVYTVTEYVPPPKGRVIGPVETT